MPATRLSRGDLVRVTRGVHAPSAPVSLAGRAAAFALGMPDERAFSHLTAAALLGLPLPRWLEAGRGAPGEDLLDVMAPTADGQVRRPGCRGHRGLESRETAVVDGVRVVDLADTWCDLGELGPRALTVEDLVVAGDAAVALIDRRAGSRVGAAALSAALARRVRPRGKVALARALTLVRHGVRSPMETRARLMFVHARFPEPEVNAPLTDRAGEWLAEGDLVWRGQRVVGEYQGEVHAERGRRSADALRRDVVEEEDWTVRELWAEDVYRSARRVRTLRRFAHALDLDPATLLIA